MPDVYAAITQCASDVLERLADVIELRAADPRHRAMLHAYLSEIDFPNEAHVLEIGCGTGAVTRTLAQWPRVARAIGLDPSTVFLDRARALAGSIGNLTFEEGDGHTLPFASESFDVTVMHTTLCHVPEPEGILAEAFRVLRAGGCAVVFDGDYATATVARAKLDPLETCIHAFRANFVHDPWLLRGLPRLFSGAGFDLQRPMRSHGYLESGEAAYMLTWVDRGADTLVRDGQIGQDAADGLKAEARRRSASREWFGFISFGSLLGRKPKPDV